MATAETATLLFIYGTGNAIAEPDDIDVLLIGTETLIGRGMSAEHWDVLVDSLMSDEPQE